MGNKIFRWWSLKILISTSDWSDILRRETFFIYIYGEKGLWRVKNVRSYEKLGKEKGLRNWVGEKKMDFLRKSC